MNDSDDIYRYISEKLFVTSAAKDLLDRIENKILNLAIFPHAGSLFNDEYLRIKGYSSVIVDSYIIFYLVNKHKKQVIIMRILCSK